MNCLTTATAVLVRPASFCYSASDWLRNHYTTNQWLRCNETSKIYSQPLFSFDLLGNLFMNLLTSTLIKLNVLGAKLWVIEVKEFKFCICLKK